MDKAKTIVDFLVESNLRLSDTYSHLILKELPDGANEAPKVDYSSIIPGQFVEVLVADSKNTFLRRPISVNFVDVDKARLHLLVRRAGDGTNALCDMQTGEKLNLVLPLGHGFSINESGGRPLLAGGGVGVAPLLYLGKILKDHGVSPTFLLAAKSKDDLLQLDLFRQFGEVLIATDDGSEGHKGLITTHPALDSSWDKIYCCGPMPMMKAIARIARDKDIPCEVSLENSMACGLGACLCCVEDTVDGHVCVCTEGPVFDIKRLKWFD